jgi:gamma-glutamyl hercynylcysteine S-oxide synthase
VKEQIAAELEGARARSLALLAPLTEAQQTAQHSSLMSPLAWDLAHVGHYEELWLLRNLFGTPPTDPLLDDVYDAFKHPRRERPSLPILAPGEARRFVGDVRGRVLDELERVDLDRADPLLDRGFVYGMVVQHEHQHDETMLATIQLMNGFAYPRPSDPPALPSDACVGREVRVDGGRFVMGTDLDAWAYDNERPAHEVTVAPFWIDTTPVTNGAYVEFVEGGGYDDPAWWSAAGWAWRREAGLEHPELWHRAGEGSWCRNRFGVWEALPPEEPVQHVCWYEADAFARRAGKRLPTETEWEMAASWEPAGRKRRHPWGNDPPTAERANLGAQRFGPAPVGSLPSGVSPWGVHQMIGDVWEWTDSDFAPHPGFESFPYREYSEVFFGPDYKVLRGGSWATHPSAVRATFRNWDLPIRRQIFAGFRCARDA